MKLKHILTEMTYVVTHQSPAQVRVETDAKAEEVALLLANSLHLQAKAAWNEHKAQLEAEFGDFQTWFAEVYAVEMPEAAVKRFGIVVLEKLNAHLGMK